MFDGKVHYAKLSKSAAILWNNISDFGRLTRLTILYSFQVMVIWCVYLALNFLKKFLFLFKFIKLLFLINIASLDEGNGP